MEEEKKDGKRKKMGGGTRKYRTLGNRDI